jgi:aryl-alcohol dehydrogenase-like predicted oxidoreductase
VAQCVANLLDSPGDLVGPGHQQRVRDIFATAGQHEVGVMGIRAVQAGALTDSVDRDLPPEQPTMVDFRRAAPFRVLARELGESPAVLAHRYALSMPGVDTVVLGVKNRTELRECVAAASAGTLPPDVMTAIETAVQPSR